MATLRASSLCSKCSCGCLSCCSRRAPVTRHTSQTVPQKTQHTPILTLSLTVVRLAADKTRDTTDPDMVTQELIDSVLTRELAKTSARKSKVSKSR